MQHTTVLLNEAVEALCCKKDGVYIDCTYGRGGHSNAIIRNLGPEGRLWAIDKDPEAITGGLLVAEKDPRFRIIQGSFSEISSIVEHRKVDGILLDLGVSSPQIDNPLRGFSFMQEGPLDMRMNQQSGMSASEWIASASKEEIANVLWVFGEERYSRKIAQCIVNERELQPITTTTRLANIIKQSHPKWEKNKHPATRSFQAIRIYINNELSDLEQALQQAAELLKTKGRLVVISFHSLEDRIVKRFIKNGSLDVYTEVPKWVALQPDVHKKRLKKIGKPIKPTDKEVKLNIRSRSAIMRIAEKCD